ncbi:aminodeoxychorismate lyase [Lysobacter auxotrophicus]|uniref:Aminodeoxychorismate lyase n=1 Tax=Lysobacter auxotrophicus TaxID=2992573 RepID=A0ABM8DF51_9GAMM|nr:aminodeoxychorismate lyase [Lysobacter auxotrophicus]BDU17237.1 aminodeoxychorismate lyase [Lysobacter auxotrophicus]
MSVRHFVGDTAVANTPDHDRGLAYGDGLFETMRAHEGDVHWWPAHWRRLERGARALAFDLPDQACVRREVASLLDDANGVLKLVVTRGPGGRGYAPPASPTPHWILSLHDAPVVAPAGGLTLRWCDTRLALQPALAGLKHCNRLEQVLARAEWRDPETHEGLMRSTEGDVVSATSANLFVLYDDRWTTPRVDRCGIAGVCREWAMGALGAREARLAVTEVEAADAVFLCNAARGILPVARLGARSWRPHPQVAQLRRRLAAEHPAFATEVA